MREFALMAGMLLLAGCSTIAESRVENALIDAGLGERTASCMAARMVDRLSIAQLRRLDQLRQPSGTAGEIGLADYIDRVRRVGDPEVLAVTATSAALCGTGLAR